MIFYYYILVLLSISQSIYSQICSNYLVRSGDTYSKLATRYKTTVQSITFSNPFVNPSLLRIGLKIYFFIAIF